MPQPNELDKHPEASTTGCAPLLHVLNTMTLCKSAGQQTEHVANGKGGTSCPLA